MPTTEAIRTTVYLESDLHHALRQDEQDLAAVRSRDKESALGYEAFSEQRLDVPRVRQPWPCASAP